MGLAYSSPNETASTLSLCILNATSETYHDFIQALRDQLKARGQCTVHNRPVLPRREEVPDAQRFLYVDLTSYDNKTIRVAIDVVNAYVVGYAANNRAYLLQENALENQVPINTIFPDAALRIQLGFDGTYGRIAAAARRGPPGGHEHDPEGILHQVCLGCNELSNHITSLWHISESDEPSALSMESQARGIFVIIQMISEAARFQSIEEQLGDTFLHPDGSSPRDPIRRNHIMRKLETSWSGLCAAIQRVPENETVPLNNRESFFHFQIEGAVDYTTYPEILGDVMILLNLGNPAAPGPGPSQPHDEL